MGGKNMIPESNEKHEQNKKKRFNIAETWGTLNEAQMNLVSWVAHTSMQKGRKLGQMEMDGHSAADIAKTLNVDVKLIETILSEKPEDSI
jgi:hypothetical protein